MYRKASTGWLKHWDFILFDLICEQAAFIVAYFIRHGLHNPYHSSMYRNAAIVFALLQICVVFFGEEFQGVLRRGPYTEFTKSVKHVGIIVLLEAFYLFVAQEGEAFSRITLVLVGVIYFAFTLLVRDWWKWCIKKKGAAQGGKRSLVILTASPMVEEVIGNIKNNNYSAYRIAGITILDRDLTDEKIEDISVVANKDTVVDYVCREWVDEVFVNLPPEIPFPDGLLNDFSEMGITTHLRLARISTLSQGNQCIEKLGTYTVWTSSVNTVSAKQALYKRLMDIAGGIVGCIITGIAFLFVAPAIYKKSPGPIFFTQTRVGKNGKLFKMYKFRSMYLDAEERKKELMKQNQIQDGMMFKMKNDPRIIGGENGKGIGNFIRNHSVDELPQFLNVLKGDMSLVGTRPPTTDEWEKYELHHRARLAVKPGITGMWQVSGRSSIQDFEEVVRMDTEYIENWTIGMDVKILLKTVKAVFSKDGAM